MDGIIPFIFRETQSLNNIDLSQIISAELLLKLVSPKKKDEKIYKKALEALIKPVSDLENVTFKSKDNKIIKGSDLPKIKIVEIGTTETGKLSEPQIFEEMNRFFTKYPILAARYSHSTSAKEILGGIVFVLVIIAVFFV